jgi:hypothetical protein
MASILTQLAPNTIPAGFVSIDVTAASLAGGTLTLTQEQAAADIIELTGALSAVLTVFIPQALIPTMVSPDAGGASGYTGGAPPLTVSWIKVFRNSTNLAHAITVGGVGASGAQLYTPLAHFATILYSLDGVAVQPAAATSIA